MVTVYIQRNMVLLLPVWDAITKPTVLLFHCFLFVLITSQVIIFNQSEEKKKLKPELHSSANYIDVSIHRICFEFSEFRFEVSDI